MPIVSCIICQKEFYTKSTGKICSDECKKKYRSSKNFEYHKKNKKRINENARLRYTNNKDYYRERDKKRYHKLRSDDKPKRKFLNLSEEEKRIRRNRLRRERYANDNIYSIKTRLRSQLNKRLRQLDLRKNSSLESYLGCDLKNFMKHIESNFKEGMSWENRSEWHIDHIVPISRANSLDDLKLLSHFSNLQPMWAKKNISKSNILGFHNVKGRLVKKYGRKEEYAQYRYESVVDFNCYKCGNTKKSKLVVVYNDDWSKIICNGCYGLNLTRNY